MDSGEAFTLETLGHDVLGLLDALGLQTVSFCGISMGGLIGQWLGIYHPERLHKLILSNTAAKIGKDETWTTRIAAVRQGGLGSIAPGVLSRWITENYRQANPNLYNRLLQMFLATPIAGYLTCCEAIRETDFREEIGQITVPTLVIAGIYDPITTVADGEFLQSHLPNAQLLEVPGAHLSSMEAALPFANGLLQFLAETTFDRGMAVRRAVLGNAHVDRTIAKRNAFNDEFQDFITHYAWGEIWTRPGLPRHSRSLITLAMLIALNRESEFKMHVRAAFNNGVTVDEIKEVLMQSALYCGLPAANAAFHVAEDVFQELGISISPFS